MTDTEISKKSRKKKTAKDYAFSFFIKVAVTVLVLWLVLKLIAGVFVCHTNDAYPSVKDGDFCLTYRLAELNQGMMIVYRHGDEIKFGRVIAFAGDKVEIFQDFISVNGYGISETSVYSDLPTGTAISYPYYVPDSCVFVMNDYRSNISDSRTFGAIPLKDVQGAVVFIMRMRGI